MELHRITKLDDPLTAVIKDDPVRPHIPLEQRVNDTAEILLLKAGEEILAATCMAWLSDIPKDEQDLIDLPKDKNTAVFYTIWSYKAGKGRDLIIETTVELKKRYPTIKRFVTLSPKTEMAHNFHISNGAVMLRENADTINYEYIKLKC